MTIMKHRLANFSNELGILNKNYKAYAAKNLMAFGKNQYSFTFLQ